MRRPEPETPEHGFVRVDEAARPADWVECLDALQREPFYRAYKARVGALLAPRAGGLYLEVGSGAGSDALALARASGARVVGVDRSLTMCRAARARGLAACLAAEAEALPFASARFDGLWSDRTFQHLADPRRALGELVRVMRPGATLVVVDPDYGTQRMPFPDPQLAQKVLDFRAHHALRSGTLAHDMARLFAEAGLDDVSAEEMELIVEDPASVDGVLGLRSWAGTACARGQMSAGEVERWETAYDRLAASGRFHWSVTFFLTRGCKPARA